MSGPECEVCYERSANCKLVCGHTFCKSCVKTWYTKGSGTCPMCRRKVHYRRMPIKKWKQEAENAHKEHVYAESFEELLEDLMEPLVIDDTDNEFPILLRDEFDPEVTDTGLILHRKNVSVSELRDLEVTFQAIKDDASPDEIDYVLNESGDYYSNRRTHLRNRVYPEPIKNSFLSKRNDRRPTRLRVGNFGRRGGGRF